jgi:hypothetical protein
LTEISEQPRRPLERDFSGDEASQNRHLVIQESDPSLRIRYHPQVGTALVSFGDAERAVLDHYGGFRLRGPVKVKWYVASSLSALSR